MAGLSCGLGVGRAMSGRRGRMASSGSILKGANRRTCRSCNRAGSNSSSTPRPPGCSASESWEDEQHVMQSRSIRQSGQPTRASASRMRAFDWDLIRGGHYGQPSCEPRFIGPNTWPHRPSCDVQIFLANTEPSTHGTNAKYPRANTNVG
jgi:hypothetical protein